MASRGTAKGPVKADHTIRAPSDGPSSATPLAAKTPIERLRKTPSPTGEKLRKTPSPTGGERLRKSPSPTGGPLLRTHTPSPTGPERVRKTPSPRTTPHAVVDKKPAGVLPVRPASTTPRKTPSPDLRQSPEPSTRGGVTVHSAGGAGGSAKRPNTPGARGAPRPAIKRSMSAMLPRAREAAASREEPGPGRVSRSLQSRDRQLRRLITQDTSLAVLDTIAMHLAELRLRSLSAEASRTSESGTQTTTDAGTQTAARGEAAVRRAVGAGRDEEGEADELDDGEVAQIAAGTERTLTNRGITPTLLRMSQTSSAASAASDPAQRSDEESAVHAPVQMMSSLGISAEKPQQPTAVYSSGEPHAAARARLPDRPAPSMPLPACPTLAGATASSPLTTITASVARVAGSDGGRRAEPHDGSEEADATDGSSAGGGHAALEGLIEPPGVLEQLKSLLQVQADEENDEEVHKLGMHKEGALQHQPVRHHGPDPIQMLSDGRHNASMLGSTGAGLGVGPRTASSTPVSPGLPPRPSSRAPGGESPLLGSASARSPVSRDAALAPPLPAKGGAEGAEGAPHAPPSSNARSPKEIGTSLFRARRASELAGAPLSLPVAARPTRVPRLDLRDVDQRAQSTQAGPAAALPRPATAHGALDQHTVAASPRGLVTSRSDVSIGSPRSAFTSVSVHSARSTPTPRSLDGSSTSTPRNPLPPISAGQAPR